MQRLFLLQQQNDLSKPSQFKFIFSAIATLVLMDNSPPAKTDELELQNGDQLGAITTCQMPLCKCQALGSYYSTVENAWWCML